MSTGVIFILGKGVIQILASGVKSTLAPGVIRAWVFHHCLPSASSRKVTVFSSNLKTLTIVARWIFHRILPKSHCASTL